MATYTPNYNLSKPEATDDFDAFRASYGDNMDIIDNNLGGGGSGGGGHTIVDPDGTSMPQENKLQFTGAVNVSDDSVNGQTVVDIEGGGNYYLNTIYSTEEKKIGYWTDGKPLYQKTFEYNGTYTGVDTNLPISIPNAETRFCVNSWAVNANSVSIPLAYAYPNNPANDCTIFISANNSTIGIRVGSGQTLKKVVVTIQYTKTTDTPELNPQTGGVIYLPTIYSEEEREVGVWTDGKPLYQKTILVTSIVSGNNTINHGISNVDKIVNAVGTFFSNANNSSPIPNGNLQTAWSVSMFDFGTTNFTISVGSSWVQYFDYIQVTIQYTKTTDTAGSGSWTPSGANAVHYSTNEQVIGTWIDGKPLYQRTWDFGSNITINSNAWTNTTINVAGNSIKAIINSKATNDGGTNYNFIACNTDQTYVQVLQTRNVAIVVRYLTLEYTKTTD